MARLETTISTAPWSCSMRRSSYWIGSPAWGVAVGAAEVEEALVEEREHVVGQVRPPRP